MRTTRDYPEASRCRKGGLHDFIESGNDGAVYGEVCRKCGQRTTWAVGIGGQSAKWFSFHARDGLQPYGEDREMFISEYGRERYGQIMANSIRQDAVSTEEIVAEAKEDIEISKRSTR